MKMADELKDLYRNMIRLKIDKNEQYELGGTRFGGVPDVPYDFVWPTFETATYDDDEVKERPLSFLAQFNCADIAALDKEGLLPHTGLLSFFYEMDSQRWGFDPKDDGCAKVFWFENIAVLRIAEVPKDLLEYYRFPQLKINATAEKSLPMWGDFSLACKEADDCDEDDCDQFEEEKALLGVEEYENCSKLLGWPDIIQNNMTRQCELVTRNYYLGRTWDGIPSEDIEEAETTSIDDWLLLFQLDIVSCEDFELMFGDSGRLYFYIRREDLMERQFDKVWLILQSC